MAEQVGTILSNRWAFKDVSLILKKWHLDFDPLKELQTRRHLWMLLPGFPLVLWTESILTGLANKLGTFVRSDKSSLFGMEKRVAQVMVEFDLNKGLPAEVEIIWGNHTFRQRLDYFGVSFRCFKCRCTGHVVARCPQFLRSGAASVVAGASALVFMDATVEGFSPDKANSGDLNFTRSVGDIWGTLARVG